MKRLLLALALVLPIACRHAHDHDDHDHDHDHPGEHDHPHDDHDEATRPAPRQRLEVPPPVQRSLGIEFVAAEERVVERTLRLPGRFEPSMAAARSYHAPLAGTVELLVEPLQRVEVGQVLGRVESPALRDRQHELHSNLHAVREAEEEVAVLKARIEGVRRQLAQVKRRLKALSAAHVRVAELESKRVELETQIPVLTAQLAGARAEVHREEHHYESRIKALAFLVGVPAETLTESGGEDETGLPWAALNELELRARRAGTVTRVGLSPGAWAAQGALILEVVDPSDLRFEATALQGDLRRLQTGQRARVVHPTDPTKEAQGEVLLGAAGAVNRTFPVWIRLGTVPEWARPGLAAFAEVVVAGSGARVTAIPTRALVRDGLEEVFFRRDPADPHVVVRTVADPGPSDGRWTQIRSGVAPGDQVVAEGAYELKLATSASPETGAHVHADGSVHGDHE